MSAEHGNTPAAWTAVTIIFLGCVVAGWAVIAGSALIGGAAVAIIVAGGVVGQAMRVMGAGQRG